MPGSRLIAICDTALFLPQHADLHAISITPVGAGTGHNFAPIPEPGNSLSVLVWLD
jgi:hypothetical protein